MINETVIYQVDAFADEPFKGNPAGVVILAAEASSTWMQNIAMEMNLSETAFILPHNAGFAIRYFTPEREVPLCGHATLASSHIIYELGLKALHETIVFQAEGGELTVKNENDKIVMNFPEYSLQKIETNKDFNRVVGFEPVEMYSSDYGWVIAVSKEEKEIANAKPIVEEMIKSGLGHLMITAKAEFSDADFVLRCFAPVSGINEDPVTGSAHCALTPLWSRKLGKNELESFQLSKRTGRMKVRMCDNRVEIQGSAITVFEIKLKI